MNKLRQYFIGHLLSQTDDVFEHARAILVLRLCYVFNIIFMLPLATDIALHYEKALVIHSLAYIAIFLFPFIIRKKKNLDWSINFFFFVGFAVSVFVFMCVNPTNFNRVGICWSMYFLVLSALLQRGKARILFACFLFWLPILYILINTELNGALTWHWIHQTGAEDPPVFLVFIPIILLMHAVWTHSTTIQEARKTITEQKKIIEEKNKDITDSIHYAKRIQNSLLPTEKYVERIFNERKD